MKSINKKGAGLILEGAGLGGVANQSPDEADCDGGADERQSDDEWAEGGRGRGVAAAAVPPATSRAAAPQRLGSRSGCARWSPARNAHKGFSGGTNAETHGQTDRE